MSATEIIGLSAAEAVEAIAAGELVAGELFEAYRERAAADRTAGADGLNCFTWVAGQGVAGQAPAGDDPAPAPLHGVPLAVKDLFCTENVPSQSGSRILEGYLPPYTATAVSRLTDAGATLLGKTNQDEFAMGSSNENSAYGPVLNPWNRERVPGGSSGGSAAAVAAGLAPWALGTDTGGSIRQPAALCGIVGLKPTYGAVSRYGMIAFASSLDQAGPLTRDVTDAALMLRHWSAATMRRDLAGLSRGDRAAEHRAVGGIRLGVPEELTGGSAGDGSEGIEVGCSMPSAPRCAAPRSRGRRSSRASSLPHAPHALAAYYVLAPAEASSNLARFDGVRYGLRAEGARDLLDMYTRTRHDGFGAEVKRRIMLGTYALSSGYYDAYYGRAQRVRTKIAEDFHTAFAQVDLIVTPTAPTVAFKLGEKTEDPLAMYLNDYCTVPMSLAGIPAISIPCGLSEGLPVGLQIAGPAFSENRLLDAAYALERGIGFDGSPARVNGVRRERDRI